MTDPFAVHFRPVGNPRHKLSAAVERGDYPDAPEVLHRLVDAEKAITAALDEAVAAAQVQYIDWLRQVVDGIPDGRALPADLLATGRTIIDSHEESRLHAMIVGDLREMVNSRWTKALAEHLDSMLSNLWPELEVIVREVREHASTVSTLDLSNPEAIAAASTEQRDAFSRLVQLRPVYRRLRSRQRALVEGAHKTPPGSGTPDTWRGVYKLHVDEFSDIPALGAPPDDLPDLRWFEPLTRSDVWLPSHNQLLEAYRAAVDPARHSPKVIVPGNSHAYPQPTWSQR